MKRLLLSILLCLGLCSPAFAFAPYKNAALTATPVLVSAVPSGSSFSLWWYNLANPNSALVYVQFFDKAAAGSVILGTTSPTFWIAIPANSGVTDNSMAQGFSFANGMVIAVTTTPTGSTAPASNIPVSLFYR